MTNCRSDDENRLLPCPFCGGEAQMKIWWDKWNRMDWYIPQCSDRSCAGRIDKRFSSLKRAVDGWNRRAG